LGAEESSSHVVRAGDWKFSATIYPALRRGTDAPTLRSYEYGFRIALSPRGK
jgi:hypothetical protein